MSQKILNAVIGAVSVAAMGLSGWALAEIIAQGRTDSEQATAALALRSATDLLIQSQREQDEKITDLQIKAARLHEQVIFHQREISRLEGRQ